MGKELFIENETTESPNSVLIKAAVGFISKGYSPIPVLFKEKVPKFKNWPNLKMNADESKKYFSGSSNIGLLLGEPSNELVDVDFDCEEAKSFSYLLPKTQMIHGRLGNKFSHYWFKSKNGSPKTKKYADLNNAMIIELRSTGCQTLIPPSVHPLGEHLEWESEGDPAEVSKEEIQNVVSKIAAGALLSRHWPQKGSRNEASLALAGMLLRNGWEDAEAQKFIETVAKTAGDEEWKDRGKTVVYTRKKLKGDQPATGVPRLGELIDNKVVSKVCDWLNFGNDALGGINGEKKLSPLQLAEMVNQEYGERIKFINQEFINYSNGYWGFIEEQNLRKRIAELDKPYTKGNRTSDALQNLKDLNTSTEIFSQNNLVCLLNGALDPLKGDILPHSPDHNLRNRLLVEWNPDANCALWRQTLNEIFQNDPDRKEKIQFLKEWFGYCLVSDTRQHKLLWLVGAGANGKSLILEILSAIVGEKNISNAMLTRLNDKFVRAELHGKLINISPEMNANGTVADGYLKGIVAGDTIEAERKFKSSFSFKPYARLIASTNELPRLLDLSQGFRRRLVILNFNRIFSEQDQDKKRKEKLLEKLPGILVWAVKGLQTLQERGFFTIPPSSKEAVGDYIIESDPVRQFAEEYLLPVSKGKLTTMYVYTQYSVWANDRGFQKMNTSTFGKRLSALGFGHRKSNGRKYLNVKIKEQHYHSLEGGEG